MSEFANRLLGKVKLTLREPSDNFDDDIKDDIDASAMDLMQAGILSYFFSVDSDTWEVDPLILRAVKWYCLSVYGLYNTDMEKYDTAYRSLKATLATQSRYSRNPHDPLFDAEIQKILASLLEISERLSKVEESSGQENILTLDDIPTPDSENPVKSKGIWQMNETTRSELKSVESNAKSYTAEKIRELDQTLTQYVTTQIQSFEQHADNKYATLGQVGDIETALDSIIAIQNSLIGGVS